MDKQREMFEAWWKLNRPCHGEDYHPDMQHHAWSAWQAAIASQWQPIDTLQVDELLESGEMFVVRAFDVKGVSTMPYTTDACAVWLESDCGCHYKFVRWKHSFKPTHWMPLPPKPRK